MRPLWLVAALIFALSGACAPNTSVHPDPGSAATSTPTDEVSQEESRLLERRNAEVAADKARIEEVGGRLLAAIPEHPRIQFLVARGDPAIDASATFNRVMISGGMLRFVESDDELAVVLGHEVAHITQGHVLGQTVAGVVLSAVAIAADCFAPGTGRLAGSIGQVFLGYYTRRQEREADHVGLRYAFRAGYDPRAAAVMTQRLAVEAPDSMSAGYFATHRLSIDGPTVARWEPDELPSDTKPTGDTVTADEAAGTAPSPINAETPVVLIDEEEPVDRSGFTTVSEPTAIFPFLTGHHNGRGTNDLKNGRVTHDRVVRNPVPPRPFPARSSIHTRVVR